MIKFIDSLLDRVTMYRLVLYYLIFLLAAAVVLCVGGVLPYDPFALLFLIAFLVAACWVTNTVFARAFRATTNVESVYISAFILALIITPPETTHDLWFIGWAAVWAMASKYILAISKKHLFNPAAFAVALTAVTINQSASWWIGTGAMMPFVLIGGILIVRRIRRSDLVLSFLLMDVATILVLSFLSNADYVAALQSIVVYSPLLFFAFIILTEPLTMPPTRQLQVYYGALVGFLFAPQVHFGSIYLTPELAILIGNVFSYIVSPKAKLILQLKERRQIAPDIYDFVLATPQKLAFAPGQYMEWTLGHKDPDSRGNRRYFTLASSPTEDNLRLGVKFNRNPSSFKQSMLAMDTSSEIVAAQLGGDFVLPEDPRQKCVFIAGGIGITPFRSMVKYLLDTHQRRPIVLFYANKTANEIVYKDIFDKAERKLGMKIIYTVSDKRNVPASWNGKVGRISAQMIRDEVPDYRNCLFYIAGPNAMVTSLRDLLRQMDIGADHIKTDFFSGLT